MASALRDSAVDLIGIRGRKFTRIVVLAGLIACCAAVAGCGGDDEEASTAPAATTPARTDTAPATTETSGGATEAETAPRVETSTGVETAPPSETSPESMPGGAGDEEPARTLALLTGRGGTIRPRVVRVPAFIAVKVELRSADGATYSLRFGGTTISTGGQSGPASTMLAGLRPGAAVVGRPEGSGNAVRIEATAEPGP